MTSDFFYDIILKKEKGAYIMKRFVKYSAMAMAAVVMAANAVPAIAAQDESADNAVNAVKETAEIKNTDDTAVKETIGYSVLKGKINKVTANDNGVSVSFEREEQGEVIFNSSKNVMVVEGNKVLGIEDLKEGAEAYVVMDDNAPMTLSLPPQTNGAIAFVLADKDAGFVQVGSFDDKLTSKTLELNIDDTVKILDVNGSKKKFTADDVKNTKSFVVYGSSTKSIPAQTTPSMVVIIEEAKADEPETTPDTGKDFLMLPLRSTLEEMGYTVKWTANDKPIEIEKEGKKAEVEIGKDTMVVDGDEILDLLESVNLIDGVTYISSVGVEALK